MLRAVIAGAAGIIIFGVASTIIWIFWSSSRWLGNFVDLASPHDLASVAITNSIVVVSAYLAVAALVWAFADATMPQPVDFGPFPANSSRAARGASLTCRIFMS